MDKRETFELLRTKARAPGHVMVACDARVPGVKVPLAFATDFTLRLNFCRWAGRGDLEVSEWGIKESLCFSGVWTPVAVPWPAIYGLFADGSLPTLFNESLPVDFVKAVRDSLTEDIDKREAINTEAKPPLLRLVK